MTARLGYSSTQIALHWLTALGVLVAFFTHDAMEELAREVWRVDGAPSPTLHTISGFLAFLLVAIRLWLRSRRGAPEPEGEGWAKQAAIWGHRALYALLLIVPLMGAVTWFGGVRGLGEVHGILGKGLMLLALGHAVIAIWHHVGKKDGTLMRMLRPEPKS